MAASLASMLGGGDAGPPTDPGAGGSDDLTTVAQDLIDGVKAGDAGAVASALKAACAICEQSEPPEPGEPAE